MIGVMTVEATDDNSDDSESYGRRCRGQRKLQMCPLVAEEAAILFLDNGRSCT